jgi:hypothetical protein
MCRFCWFLSAVLAILLAAAVYVFVFMGSTRPADDGRTAILLSPSERNLVLAEMRAFLEATRDIVSATASGDVATALAAARRVARARLDDLPPGLLRKLPAEVKALGLDTHRAFGDLARIIEGGANREQIYTRLGEIMLNCTTCHAGYRIDPEERGQ